MRMPLHLFVLYSCIAIVPCEGQESTPRAAPAATTVSTLEYALALVLEQNPKVKSLSYDIRSRDELIRQAGLIPNPELDLTVEQFGASQDGVDPAQSEVKLSQRIELGGKRSSRIGIASAERERTQLESQAAIVELLGEVKKSWARLKYLTEERKLRAEQLDTSRSLVEAVRRRVEAGATLPAELLKAQTAVETDRIDLTRGEQEIAAASQSLAAFWGGTPASVSFSIGEKLEIAPVAALTAKSVRESFQGKLLQLQVLVAEQTLGGEKAKGVQDPTVSAGYQRLNGIKDNAFLVALSVPLPLFDRNQGAIMSAENALQAAKLKASNEQLKLEARVRVLLSALRAFDFESEQLSRAVIPQASKTFHELQNAFSLGKASFLDVIDAQRTVLRAKSRSLEVERERYETQVEVETITANEPMSINK